MAQKEIRFGLIGLGLMGREFGSAVARWMHLLDVNFTPKLVGICDTNPAAFEWFESNFDDIRVTTQDYHDLLNSDEIDAIYCAVPHNLHAKIYTDIIRAGKHLFGEKPFGIDITANEKILSVIQEHPDVFVACSSELPFFPGAQRVIQMIRENPFGKIIEVDAGFLHSSDINPDKAINWKRMIAVNGEYGCMGDLGMHVLHVPLRMGWFPQTVHAQLSNIMTERYNADGEKVPCETWDNAILNCWVADGEQEFPMTLRTYRIAPGETNTWYLRVTGTEASATFSTRYPKTFRTMFYQPGSEQVWGEHSLGYTPPYPTISGGIFEFGFSDSLLQMWAAFCDELTNGRDGMKQPFYCVSPEETHLQHRVLTAALNSFKQSQIIQL